VEILQCKDYLDQLLSSKQFKDYCPNGLQVSGKTHIKKIVSGVTANLSFIDAAIHASADAILVHHGLFWHGDDYCLTNMKYERIKHLIKHQISVFAYHLPLDAHEIYGNNAQLANLLDLSTTKIFDLSANQPLGFLGETKKSILAVDFAKELENKLSRKPVHIHAGPGKIKKIAWCTGAAQKYIHLAKEQGADAYISGEISESTTHAARELGIHYFAAGHHATERYGVQAVGKHLAENFGLIHEFIDIDNPA
jgi:dinuclear metal center YbgI/SA1388 family protein